MQAKVTPALHAMQSHCCVMAWIIYRRTETQRFAKYNNPIAGRNRIPTELVPEHGWACVWEADVQMKLCFLTLSQVLC